MNSLNRCADTVYCLMRLILGLTFACHGGQKILGFPPGGHGAGEGMMLIGAWIELVGGLLIAFGLFTRIAAFISSGEMAVAYYMHATGMFADHPFKPVEHVFPILNKGELAVLYCWFFLFVFFYGAGWLSLDAIFCRKSTAGTATAPAA